MARAKKEYRELTVSEACSYGRTTAPMLRIQGRWFEELGFHIGDPVLVKCEEGKIIIMADTAMAQLKKAEKAFMEECTHKAIVSRETFDSVQMMMDRDTIKAADGGTSLFAGMLFCGDCGKSMVRRVDSRNRERSAHYICSNYNRNKECSRHSVCEDELKEAVESFLRDHIDRLANARRMSQSIDFLEIGFEAAAEHDRDIVKLKEELLRCSTLKSSLYQDLKEGIINESQFNRYREEYTNREMALQEAIEEQERVIRDIYDGKIASGVQLEEIQAGMNISGLSRTALVTFIDRILVYEGMKLEIVTKYDAVIDKVVRINDGINYGWKEAV